MQPHFPNTNKPEWKVPLKALVPGAKSRNTVELSAPGGPPPLPGNLLGREGQVAMG